MDVIFIEYIDELRECWCNELSLFILNPKDTLLEHFLDHHSKVFSGLTFWYLIKIHIYCDERSLTICSHKSDDLILDNLASSLNLFSNTHLCDLVNLLLVDLHSSSLKLKSNFLTELLSADINKWNQVRQCNTLSAVL